MATESDTSPLADLSQEEQKALAEIATARADGRISRRDTLKAAGLLGGGALMGGAASSQLVEPASAGSQQSGTIGTASNPVDVEAEDITASVVDADIVNNTYRVEPTDDLNSVVANDLQAGDHLIIDRDSTTAAHQVDSTLVFDVAVSIEFRGFVEVTGDFTAIELNHVSGTYTLYPKGDAGFIAKETGNTTAGSHGLEAHSGYQMAAEGRINGFDHGVFHHQAQTNDKLNHCKMQWLIGNTAGDGLRNENTSGDPQNVSGHQGVVHVFNTSGEGVHMIDGGRHNIKVIAANGTSGSAALLEESTASSSSLYWVEEEGYGNVSDTGTGTGSQIFLISSDKSPTQGWDTGNPRTAKDFVGGDETLSVGKFRVFQIDTSSPRTVTLPTGAAAGTEVILKDDDANAGSNFITIATETGASYDGSSITTDKGFRRIVQIGGDNWKVVGGNAI